MDVKTILSYVTPALTIAGEVATALASAGALPAAEAVATGIKIAEGVAASVPEAQALYAQFQSGTIPTQAELDAYAAGEDSAYAKAMAAIDAALPAGG